jgi:hypothetical protein
MFTKDEPFVRLPPFVKYLHVNILQLPMCFRCTSSSLLLDYDKYVIVQHKKTTDDTTHNKAEWKRVAE